MKQEFLELGKPYKNNHVITGWFDSEKIDGMRCFWDGGISRGLLKADVPWANTAKDGRYKEPQVATGLWSRYGNVIHAPDYWLDDLPRVPFDAELWNGRYGEGQRQNLMKIVKRIKPSMGWSGVKAYVFNLVPLNMIFADRGIKGVNYTKKFVGICDWVTNQNYMFDYLPLVGTMYEFTVKLMPVKLISPRIEIIPQVRLSYNTEKALVEHRELLDYTTRIGGEGRMLTHPDRIYKCERRYVVLKDKHLQDDEGRLVGFVSGRVGKLHGMVGAMILDYKGHRLELSGFREPERELIDNQWALDFPGQDMPTDTMLKLFKIGEMITFTYRELSLAGIPTEARYLRQW